MEFYSFLKYVAKDLINKYGCDLSNLTVVFPNKRASIFFNKELANATNQYIWAPTYSSIKDLFLRESNLVIGDRIKLISDLYKVFKRCTHTEEEIDNFYPWGEILLEDFDDIDKNLANAKQIFLNLKDLRELDRIDYLTDNQREILKRFFIYFEENSSKLKDQFKSIWNHLGEIYDQYVALLLNQGIGYEGLIYRKVVENEFQYGLSNNIYIFVGFNMLNQVEIQLFKTLLKQCRAKFYWDYDTYFLNDEYDTGKHLQKYLRMFPNELQPSELKDSIYDNIKEHKTINYISSSTETIQARYVNKWLQDNHRIEDGEKTAIVLCNESLLLPTIHSLPSKVKKMNITTGYPLLQTAIVSLIDLLFNLQITGHEKSKGFKTSVVKQLLKHPYMAYLTDKHREVLDFINQNRVYYLNDNELLHDDNLRELFKAISLNDTFKFCQWINKVLELLGIKTKDEIDILLKESIYHAYKINLRLLNLIKEEDLIINLSTYHRLLKQIFSTTTIPFHGDPAEGIQVMGVLETRNLDFKHLLILSCNEGNMPKSAYDTSFIPYNIKKVHGLTTSENKNAIFAYYFFSLIQRCPDITIVYNKSTENGHTGEMSRFMLKLLIDIPNKIHLGSIQVNNNVHKFNVAPIQKNEKVVEILNNIERLSPTDINRYIRCQLQFFYYKVAGLKELDDNNFDETDHRIFGNIFHKAAEELYKPLLNNSTINIKKELGIILRNKKIIENAVEKAFSEEFHKQNKNKKYEYNGLQLINKEVIVMYLEKLLKIDINSTPEKILGLEKNVRIERNISNDTQKRKLIISGFIDRLDQVEINGRKNIRIIDYKTGGKPNKSINEISEVFSNKNVQRNHSDYYLQTMLYALIQKEITKEDYDVSPNLFFIQQMQVSNNPTDYMLSIGKSQPIIDINQWKKDFEEKLDSILAEIFDTSANFYPTDETEICANCPYSKICGR